MSISGDIYSSMTFTNTELPHQQNNNATYLPRSSKTSEILWHQQRQDNRLFQQPFGFIQLSNVCPTL